MSVHKKEPVTVYFVGHDFDDEYYRFDTLEEVIRHIEEMVDYNGNSASDYAVYTGSRYGTGQSETKVTIERA